MRGIFIQVKCEVNLKKISQEASDGRCSVRYTCIGNFYKTLNLITNYKLKHHMHLLIIRSTIKRAKKRNRLKYLTQKPFISFHQTSMILGSMVRAGHLRAGAPVRVSP